jgi:hypothetical protein
MLTVPFGPPTHDAHHVIARHLGALGVAVPEGVQRVLDLDAALVAAATADPLDVIRAGILGGTLTPAKAPKALGDAASAMLAVEKAEDARRALLPTLDLVARQALAADAERIVADLRPAFDDAAARLVADLAVLGPEPDKRALTTPAGAHAWHDREAALAVLADVHTVRTDLAEVGHGGAEAGWYVAGHLDGALPANPWRWWDVIAAGYTLRLNTAAEADAVAQGAVLLVAERERSAAEAERAAWETSPEGQRQQRYLDAMAALAHRPDDAA